jgi:hypothetical protein
MSIRRPMRKGPSRRGSRGDSSTRSRELRTNKLVDELPVGVFLKKFGKVDMHGEWANPAPDTSKRVEAGLRSVEPLREVMADDQLRSEMGARGQQAHRHTSKPRVRRLN